MRQAPQHRTLDRILLGGRIAVFSCLAALGAVGCGGDSGTSGTGDGGESDASLDVDDGSIDGATPFADTVIKDIGGGDTADADADGAEVDSGDATDATDADADDTSAPGPGEMFYPCDDNTECLSGHCVVSELGKVCSDFCIETCPKGWECEPLQGGPDAAYICVSRFANLCKPCSASEECNVAATSGHACIDFDGNGSFCGASCTETKPCPTGYSCELVPLASGATVRQCRPEGDECKCRDSWIAQSLATDCTQTTEFGVCEGERVCGPDGLTECSADIPEEEICNGVDDDCDGIIDPPGVGGCVDYWTDNDNDGYGLGLPECLCKPPGAKWATQGGDCDDADPDVKPGADEYCNGDDDNCNGETDEAGAIGCLDYFADADGDKFGDESNIVCLCKPNSTVTSVGGDCDDGNSDVNPNAIEACDGIDNNCDGVTDDANADGCEPYFFDGDDDGFGVDGLFQCLCAPSEPYTATEVGDCDDANPDVKPFQFEACDGIDNNCDGGTDDIDPIEMCGQVSKGTPECVGGFCKVGDCEPGYFDIDGDAINGCECKTNSIETSGPACGSAFNLGTLNDNGATVTAQGIVVFDNESDWYRLTANDGPDPAQSGAFCDTYHVRVRFLFNPENTYQFDVHRGSCAAGDQICVETDDFSWRTDFFESKLGECPCQPDGVNTAPGVQRCTNNSASYWIRVYRNPVKPPICASYNLEFTNGVY